MCSSTDLPRIVLDSNVVLDWLVFHDSRCRSPTQQIEAGTLQWIATLPMLDELTHVLGRPLGKRFVFEPEAVLQHWHRWVQPSPDSGPIAWPGRLRCADRDDQKFIDLAVTRTARWLLTRDRALLKLARAARAQGVVVCKPEDWAP